jgi:hypothetical protein
VVIRPPKAALTFLRATIGKSKGKSVSSIVANLSLLNFGVPSVRQENPAR